MTEFIPYWDIIEQTPEDHRENLLKPTNMEKLDIKRSPQRFGSGFNVQVHPPVLDLDDVLRNFGSQVLRDSEYVLKSNLEGCDLMVENLGRENFGSPHNFEQKKVLWEGDVLLENEPFDDWEHIVVEMKPK